MFGSKSVLPGSSNLNKSLIFLLLLVLLSAIVLGLALGDSEMLAPGAKVEGKEEVQQGAEETREVQQSKDLTLIIWLLLAFIFGLITGVMLSTPRLPRW